MTKNLTFLFLVLPLITTEAQQPDPVQLMEKSRDLTMTGTLRSTMTLTISEKNGATRVRKISMASRTYGDIEKRMIRFIEPADVRGTSMLIVDNEEDQDEMWIYLPALKRTRRIVTGEKGKSFMSSEFSNADMTSSPLSDFTISHLQGSGQEDLWLLESKPVSTSKADEYGYSRKVTTLGIKDMRLRGIDFYNFDGILFRTIDILGYQPLEGREGYIMTEMVVKNLINGRSSKIKYDEIDTSQPVPDNIFTVEYLSR